MRSPYTMVLVMLSLISTTAACSTDSGSEGSDFDADSPDTTDEDAAEEDADGGASMDVMQDVPCDDTRRPIVFVHGFLASGDTYATQAMRFASNGYCDDRIYAFDWNSLDRTADHIASLDDFVLAVLAETGADSVDLAGHSAGGGIGYDYLADPGRAARVAHYAHIGSNVQDAPAGPDGSVPTLNLWSSDDLIVPGGDIEGAVNVELNGVDHYGVATSAESFDALYKHFNEGEAPTTTEIVPTERIEVWGRASSLGENRPEAGGLVEVYRLDGSTGFRMAPPAPVGTFTIDEDGSWGPLQVYAEEFYEFRVQPAGDESVAVHYYREPFVRSNGLVYLRTLPEPGGLAGILLGGIDFEADAAVLVNFTASTGIVSNVDSLTVDGMQLATDELAAPESTTIAIFAYDANGNEESEGVPVPLFESFPFLAGVDLHFAGDPGSTLEVSFNGRVLRAPRWPVNSEGVTITVFE